MKGSSFTRLYLTLVLLFGVAPALAQLAPNLTGTWKAKEGDVTVTLVLNADGTGRLDNAKIKYAVRGRTLSIDDSGTVNNYSFELAGNKLTVSGGDLKQPMVFEREGATAAGGLGARRQAPAGKTAADAPSTASSGPAGAWEMRTPSGVMTMVLNEDGSGNFNGDAGKWKFERGILMVSGGTTTYMFNASITPTTMTLTNATLPQPLVFTRAGAPAGKAAASASPAPKESTSVVGDWQGPKGLVRFAADGSMVMQGEKYRYTIQGSTLTMTAPDGSIPFQYKLAGDTLTLSGATGAITLKRLSGATGAGAGAVGRAAGGGKILPELAGKWCDFGSASGTSGYGGSSRQECFTLFPDGRYQYFYEGSFSAYSNVSPTYGVQPGVTGMGSSQSSDEGTWTATATTITANSKKQGVTTYTLEKKNHPKTGDAMLCLDGKCFTTALQRPPWR